MTDELRLQKPTARWRTPFLDAVHRSRGVHRPFVHPPADETAYDAWLKRLRRPAHIGNLLIHPEEGLVGVINVNEIVAGCFQSGYLGYYVFAPFQGRGYMTRGLALVIERAFGEWGLHRLEANIQPENARSIALVKRLGFACEGYSPRYLKIAGRWRDHERWALLRENQRHNAPS